MAWTGSDRITGEKGVEAASDVGPHVGLKFRLDFPNSETESGHLDVGIP